MSDSSDERLDQEIEAALDGVNLQELDLERQQTEDKARDANLVKGTVVISDEIFTESGGGDVLL